VHDKEKEREKDDDDDEAKKPSSYFLQKIPTGKNTRRCLYVPLFEKKKKLLEKRAYTRDLLMNFMLTKKKYDRSFFFSLFFSLL
jgi:hypothetical protein